MHVLKHFAPWHETFAATLLDLQRLEHAAAEVALHLLDGRGGSARQRNETAGAAIMAAGAAAELADDVPERLACLTRGTEVRTDSTNCSL